MPTLWLNLIWFQSSEKKHFLLGKDSHSNGNGKQSKLEKRRETLGGGGVIAWHGADHEGWWDRLITFPPLHGGELSAFNPDNPGASSICRPPTAFCSDRHLYPPPISNPHRSLFLLLNLNSSTKDSVQIRFCSWTFSSQTEEYLAFKLNQQSNCDK